MSFHIVRAPQLRCDASARTWQLVHTTHAARHIDAEIHTSLAVLFTDMVRASWSHWSMLAAHGAPQRCSWQVKAVSLGLHVDFRDTPGWLHRQVFRDLTRHVISLLGARTTVIALILSEPFFDWTPQAQTWKIKRQRFPKLPRCGRGYVVVVVIVVVNDVVTLWVLFCGCCVCDTV